MQKKQTLREKKHQQILAAAITEFQANGVQATSMDRIAEQAGASKRTVYNHFPSKEALLMEITEQLWQQWARAIDFPYQLQLPIKEQLTAIAEQEMALFASPDHIALSRLVLAEYLHSPELARDAMSKMKHKESGLHCWLEAAVADGQLVVMDVEFAANQFLGMLKSFAFWPQIIAHAPHPSAAESRRIIDSAVNLFLGHYQAS